MPLPKIGDWLVFTPAFSTPVRLNCGGILIRRLQFAGKTTEAATFTAGFAGTKPEFKSTSTYWRALFLLGNLDHTQETALLELGARDCPDASLRLDFVLRLGQLAFCKQQDTEAAKYFTMLRSAAKPDDYRAIAAGKYLGLISARSP